jgi:hypothetical protein
MAKHLGLNLDELYLMHGPDMIEAFLERKITKRDLQKARGRGAAKNARK